MRVDQIKNGTSAAEPIVVNVGQLPLIHNVFIVDASGSMSGIKYQNAIEGVNELLVSIKGDTLTRNTVTLVEFEEQRIARRLNLVEGYTSAYIGMGTGGMTPLNQAIGETLEYVASKVGPNDKVLVNVFTDGGENSSRGKYSDPRVLKSYIDELEARGFTVTFIGTKNEVNYAINTLNLKASNTLVHENTGASVKKSFDRTVRSRQAYSKSVSLGEDVTLDFYTKSID